MSTQRKRRPLTDEEVSRSTHQAMRLAGAAAEQINDGPVFGPLMDFPINIVDASVLRRALVESDIEWEGSSKQQARDLALRLNDLMAECQRSRK